MPRKWRQVASHLAIVLVCGSCAPQQVACDIVMPPNEARLDDVLAGLRKRLRQLTSQLNRMEQAPTTTTTTTTKDPEILRSGLRLFVSNKVGTLHLCVRVLGRYPLTTVMDYMGLLENCT
jgi:hypothetical protein